jgi:hypothetical protein
MPGLYRVRQFLRAVRAQRPSAEEWEMLQAILTPTQMEVFRCLPPYDQRHSLEVLQALRAAGYVEPALLTAALLHDAAKTRLPLHHRALVVLARTLAPRWAARWSEGKGIGWTAPFVVARRHADWAAEMAARAGSDPMTVAIIRRHHDLLDNRKRAGLDGRTMAEEDRLLAAFQAADDDS